jgi:hypothetical protein
MTKKRPADGPRPLRRPRLQGEDLFGGGAGLLGRQALAVVTFAAYSFGITWLIATVLIRTVGVRVDRNDEHGGLDLAVHGETAYELVPHAVSGSRTASHSQPGRIGTAEPVAPA